MLLILLVFETRHLTVVENVFGVDVIIKVCGRKQDLQILVATYHS